MKICTTGARQRAGRALRVRARLRACRALRVRARLRACRALQSALVNV